MTEKERIGREHVAAWRASGLTQRRYCEEHEYSRSSLGYWSWKINNEKRTDGFVEVPIAGNSTAESATTVVELCVGERYRLRIAEGFSAQALRRVLDVIEPR